MIKLISREEVFYLSAIADHYISNRQYNWHPKEFEWLKQYYAEESIGKEEPFDHTEPFHNDKVLLDDFAVLSYINKREKDHVSNRSQAFMTFFELMGVKQLYLLDLVKCNWNYFPYKSVEKLQTIKQIVGDPGYCEAFQFDIEELAVMLPLFYFSGRFNMEIFYIFSANTDVEMAMFACDDGNFHTSFTTKDREKIINAALGAGLLMGGVEVCSLR